MTRSSRYINVLTVLNETAIHYLNLVFIPDRDLISSKIVLATISSVGCALLVHIVYAKDFVSTISRITDYVK
jgi:hypothetical protein